MSGVNTDLDIDAMLRLQRGEDLALNELMDRWKEPLVSFLVRTISNHRDAVDIAQETFVRLYQNRKSYHPSGKFSTYLFTIAMRLAKNKIRWRIRHPEIALDGQDVDRSDGVKDTLIAHVESPAEYLLRQERADEVRQCVAQLPPELRESIILYEYHDLSYSEIAEIKSCSIKAVENQLYRARKQLKMCLWRSSGD
ncbi:MAG TPA: sigma-70 family RNA polymerase sigma factor [Kiritimatiellia bacterium]|nr:sigma-70 family RNA polymerase sigma factor [Kiritimatiellia bacterium]